MFKQKSKDYDRLFERYVQDMTDFLIAHSINPETARKLSEDFWKKNIKKINEVVELWK